MNFKQKSYSCDKIQKIEINCKIYKIRVVESTSENIEISWYDTVMRNLEVKLDESSLKILDHASIGIYGTLALIDLKKDKQLLIKIPKNYCGKAIFQSTEESITISDLNCNASIGISTSTGEILLENVCCDNLDIRGHMSKINCYSLDTKSSISISSKSGNINCNLKGSEDDYTVSCISKNRRNTLNNIKGNGPKNVSLSSEHGKIDVIFQNGFNLKNPSSKYSRKNSFQDW